MGSKQRFRHSHSLASQPGRRHSSTVHGSMQTTNLSSRQNTTSCQHYSHHNHTRRTWPAEACVYNCIRCLHRRHCSSQAPSGQLSLAPTAAQGSTHPQTLLAPISILRSTWQNELHTLPPLPLLTPSTQRSIVTSTDKGTRVWRCEVGRARGRDAPLRETVAALRHTRSSSAAEWHSNGARVCSCACAGAAAVGTAAVAVRRGRDSNSKAARRGSRAGRRLRRASKSSGVLRDKARQHG